ncbi:helix-turn-helix domain-containing protein [Streptomyces sp. UH6]|uniref:helix-turn-helix domain-containing protein n=1 Tax=Streptomyces sp. UH6 TaxID=2748379 RepID=UPI0015D4E8A5|nr:helix-turn-helix domain-containing protein [Streptomyces sp. UH6]NYV74096.1 helix-turn-helix transcriptional regulator [Streptomyces sp. UH6]
MLQALGLSADESRVYHLLAGSGRSRIDRVGQSLGMSGGQLDGILVGLADKGLVTVTDDLPPQLIPAPPDIAGETLLLSRMQELQSAKAVLRQLTKAYRKASGAESLEDIAEVVPEGTLAQRYEQMQRRACQEVLRFDTAPYLVDEDLNTAELAQLTSGVHYRAVYDRAAMASAGAQGEMRQYAEAGEQARVLGRLPVKLLIVDRSIALVALRTDGAGPPGAVVQIHEGALLDALTALFELVWASALPLGHGTPAMSGKGELSATEIQLLLLLLSGLTDDAIARQLNVGKRTVNRRIRDLMDLAGASSRLQLGWQASERGWVTTSDVHTLQAGGPR